MSEVHDVVVVGIGAMGSAAAWALSKAGHDVVAVEQFGLGHDKGSSHGATRIYRVGTEQTHYLDLAQRARVLWAELEGATGTQLLTVQGAVEHGVTERQVEAFVQHLRARGIEHEVVAGPVANERWPGMRFDGPVLHQAGGAIVHADRAAAGLQRLAREHGATLLDDTRVDRIEVGDEGVVVHTAGRTLRGRRAVVTVGSWAPGLLGGVVPLPAIRVTQEQPRFFEPVENADDWPCFVHWRHDRGEWGRIETYGLWERGAGYKVGLHAAGPVVDPDHRDFQPEPQRDEVLRAYVRSWFPGLDAERSTPLSCLYDNTANGDFVIDRFGPVTIATGFNGEGFKFVPVVGEMLRDLVQGDVDPLPLFTVARHRAG